MQQGRGFRHPSHPHSVVVSCLPVRLVNGTCDLHLEYLGDDPEVMGQKLASEYSRAF